MGAIFDDVGIYVGSAFVYGCTKKRGVVLCEPAVVAVECETRQILTAGAEAEELMKKAKVHAKAVRPFAEGRLADFFVFRSLLTYAIRRVCGARTIKPRVALCLPDCLTNVERSAAKEAAYFAGARRVALVSKALAANFGIRSDFGATGTRFLIHFGGDSTIFALVDSANIIFTKQCTLSQNRLNRTIQRHFNNQYGIFVSGDMAQSVLSNLGCFVPRDYNLKMNVTGKRIDNGKTTDFTIDSNEIYGVFKNEADAFICQLADVLANIPAAFFEPVNEEGIVLTGAGSALYGIDKLIYHRFGIGAHTDLNAERSVPDGLSKLILGGTLFAKQREA